MSTEDENRAVIEEFWVAYNDERVDDCLSIYDPNARLRHSSVGIDVTGVDAIRELMEGALAAVPGRRSHPSRIVSTGDTVVAETHFEGKVAGTDDQLHIDMCYVYDFADGSVIDVREY